MLHFNPHLFLHQRVAFFHHVDWTGCVIAIRKSERATEARLHRHFCCHTPSIADAMGDPKHIHQFKTLQVNTVRLLDGESNVTHVHQLHTSSWSRSRVKHVFPLILHQSRLWILGTKWDPAYKYSTWLWTIVDMSLRDQHSITVRWENWTWCFMSLALFRYWHPLLMYSLYIQGMSPSYQCSHTWLTLQCRNYSFLRVSKAKETILVPHLPHNWSAITYYGMWLRVSFLVVNYQIPLLLH